MDAAAAPKFVGGVDVFGDEGDLGGAADELVVLGAALGRDEREDCAAVGRGDSDPAVAELEAGVGDDGEAELVDEEGKAAIVVADEDRRGEDAQVLALFARAGRGGVDKMSHGCGACLEGCGFGGHVDLPELCVLQNLT